MPSAAPVATEPPSAPELGTTRITEQVFRQVVERRPDLSGDYLDIGAGHGELIQLMQTRGRFRIRACDYTTELMRAGVPVDVVDLNTAGLPYPDASFDVVTCVEVIEHLEHYRFTLREAARVLRPGGVLVVTTPNVLNLKSRLRYLVFGFFNLFGPLHVQESRLYSTGGHINPVSYFYIAHSLCDAGFGRIKVAIDKWQRGYFVPAALLFLPIALAAAALRGRERTKFKTLDQANEPYVKAMNSWDLLLGRTVIVSCSKA